jgi:two-component system response regulator DesR
VRNHLSAAMHKLGARNRAEAVQMAQRKGWL